MKGFFAVIMIVASIQNPQKERIMTLNGTEVKTTYQVESMFYGLYRGNKQGSLELLPDGTGTYRYDYSALMRSCESAVIAIDWGFLLDESGQVVRFERPYGYSYPIIYNCTGANSFRNCTMTSMIDYIMVYKSGTINVSSSDDWKKVAN